MSGKRDTGWRKRVSGTSAQIGQAFHVEPHGDKTQLPKALQQIRPVGEIEEMLAKQKRKNMTPEELYEEELINQAIEEATAEEEDAKRRQNVLAKLNAMFEKREKRERLKNALNEAKEEERLNEGTDGYEEQEEDRLRRENERRENSVFG